MLVFNILRRFVRSLADTDCAGRALVRNAGQCLSSWPFTDPFRVFSNPLESLRGLIFYPLDGYFIPFVEIYSPCPTFGGSLSSFLQPLSGPSSSFVALRGYPFAFSWKSFLPFPTFGGSLSSLLQPLSGPSPFFVALRGYLFAFSWKSPLPDLWQAPLEPSPTP